MRLFTKKQFPLLLSAGYRFFVLQRKIFFVWPGALHGLRLMSKRLSFFFFFAVGNLQNAPNQLFFKGIFCYASFQNALSK